MKYLKNLMNKYRQTKEYQRPVSRSKDKEIVYESDFIGKLHLLRKKYPNDASFGAEVDKLLKNGNSI